MDIKISLKQLTTLFVRSAADEELPNPVRQFAARLTVLTAHVERVEAKIDAKAKMLDGLVAELANLVMAARQATAAAPSPNIAPPADDAPIAEDSEEDNGQEDEGQAMADAVIRETEADMAAIADKAPPVEKPSTSVTPLRKANSGGRKEAS